MPGEYARTASFAAPLPPLEKATGGPALPGHGPFVPVFGQGFSSPHQTQKNVFHFAKTQNKLILLVGSKAGWIILSGLVTGKNPGLDGG